MQLEVANNPYIQFRVYDIPQCVNLDEFCKADPAVKTCGAMIYIIDAKATPYDKACENFKYCASALMRVMII